MYKFVHIIEDTAVLTNQKKNMKIFLYIWLIIIITFLFIINSVCIFTICRVIEIRQIR